MTYLRYKLKKKKKVKFLYKNKEMPKGANRINSLVSIRPLKGGRNNSGVCVFRRRGGGVKNFFRFLDFYHIIWEIPAFALRKEYDPSRTAFVLLVCYINGMLSYYLATDGIKRRNVLRTTNFFLEFTKGYTMKLKNIPEGSLLNSVELSKNSGGKIARAAGTFCILLKKFSSKKILVRLPSKEEIFLKENFIATIGRVSNLKHRFLYLYKAGQNRWRNKKPVVRGVARNPIDHPHGGGGGKPSVTLWGNIAKNFPTRKKNKYHNNVIVLSRKKKKKKITKIMTRSKWKSLYIDPVVYYQFQEIKKINKNINENELLSFEIWSRNSTIIPQFRNAVVEIYNGNKFIPLRIDTKLNGHKLGEFALTKKLGPLIHILGKKKKKK